MITISTDYKLISLAYTTEYILIGDCRGNLYKLSEKKLNKISNCNSPISQIKIYNNNIYYSTWDGEIYKNDKCIKIKTGIIKTFHILNDIIYVSLDLNIYVINLNLEVLNCIPVDHKVLCMSDFKNELVLGFNNNQIGLCKFNTIKYITTKHFTGILNLFINDGKIVTGSVDGTIRNKNNLIFKTNKWIRDIYDLNLFCSGNDVWFNNNILYSHNDEVMRVVKFHNDIISIGLDCKIIIYRIEELSEKEKQEIEELNKLIS
ncbi:hypothetical protein NAPIS_ORF00071 [Vairimorpha apis BRL 01]|uniref:Uncharacterized protein n=1 Tax=Vairimorpha apis BRL 01 TaxID=1037528 RepID=T0MGW5_9MICR|nr:hypothetical protein NAPIS_ORF00071 [Vairimorpha apis BRL 01]